MVVHGQKRSGISMFSHILLFLLVLDVDHEVKSILNGGWWGSEKCFEGWSEFKWGIIRVRYWNSHKLKWFTRCLGLQVFGELLISLVLNQVSIGTLIRSSNILINSQVW